jgi:16S rRNA (guanine527-N7)-methyltransferase
MDVTHIATSLEPFLVHPLEHTQLEHISIYIDLLLRWNARINLTAVRKEEEIVTRHFGESLFLARHLFQQSKRNCHPERSQARSEATGLAQSKHALSEVEGEPYVPPQSASSHGVSPLHSTPPTVIDIGSGAGFPGIPLKLWAPEIHLTLIESNHKKAAFLKEVVRALTLINVDVITERAEKLTALPTAEIVTLRAVERFETILPQAIRFLAPTGRLALLIGASQQPHLARTTNLHWQLPIAVPLSENRVLAIGHKGSGLDNLN